MIDDQREQRILKAVNDAIVEIRQDISNLRMAVAKVTTERAETTRGIELRERMYDVSTQVLLELNRRGEISRDTNDRARAYSLARQAFLQARLLCDLVEGFKEAEEISSRIPDGPDRKINLNPGGSRS
jgi:hypothetical protein